jgi:MFS family permease
MVYPALHALTVERYGITIDRASWFVLVPTLGAIASAFVLPRLVRRWSPLRVLQTAALVEAVFLLAIAAPIPYSAVVALRFLSGACDLAGIAAALRIASTIARSDEPPPEAEAGTTGHRGRWMGTMGTSIMLGLLVGIGIGAALPVNFILPAAAAMLLAQALAGGVVAAGVPPIGRPDDAPVAKDVPTARIRREKVASALMFASDRGLAAVLSLVVPLVFGGNEAGQALVGSILGLSMLGMVIGGPIGGHLVDRFGALRMRLIGAGIFGLGTLGIVLAAPLGGGAMIVMAAITGMAAAPLFASALAIGTRHEGGTAVFAILQAAGQAGYALGSASLVLAHPTSFGAPETLAMSAIVYVALNVGLCAVLRRRRPASG